MTEGIFRREAIVSTYTSQQRCRTSTMWNADGITDGPRSTAISDLRTTFCGTNSTAWLLTAYKNWRTPTPYGHLFSYNTESRPPKFASQTFRGVAGSSCYYRNLCENIGKESNYFQISLPSDADSYGRLPLATLRFYLEINTKQIRNGS